ncbi:putative nuclease HARBI1 [Harpegnathos saltator]|uniref:putative nuclease HARBI1 n=1 Tax=Harpegnathos saltator TaxID=610380 RepID=UPI000DBEDAB8|nr:putative nuclease HARBI1 [Harpegnathos saltator]
MSLEKNSELQLSYFQVLSERLIALILILKDQKNMRRLMLIIEICDPELKILNVNARYPGTRHDAYIWSNSPIHRIMERRFNNGERNTWLIGDDGYNLEPWLMTPLKHEIPGSPRFRYNNNLCSARSCVERLFGVWKAVFKCLSVQRRLMYKPGMAGKIMLKITKENVSFEDEHMQFAYKKT